MTTGRRVVEALGLALFVPFAGACGADLVERAGVAWMRAHGAIVVRCGFCGCSAFLPIALVGLALAALADVRLRAFAAVAGGALALSMYCFH